MVKYSGNKSQGKTNKPAGENLRKRAESLLKTRSQKEDFHEADLLNLLHELQVHQIELEMMNEELCRSKEQSDILVEKLKLALETGNICLWELDLKNYQIYFDDGCNRIFRTDRSIGNLPEKISDLICEEDLEHFKKAVTRTLTHETPFETLFRTKDGKEGGKFITAKAHLKKDRDGKALALTGVFFDITGLKADSEKLIASLNEDLLRSNKELQNFVYVATHDLQEPLRMVTSFTQLLKQKYDDKLDDQAREYISFAVEGAKRMYELLNDLLAYSRTHTRLQDLKPVDLNSVMKSVLNNLNLTITERKAQLKSDELPVIIADGSQMIQLFQNLISNSIKFSTERPVIEITSAITDNNCVISIKDNGIGFEPQYYDKIFLMFQRLVPRSEYEGSGIGLAICRKIVELHGGNIQVESSPGNGSVFTFTLPLSSGQD